MDLKLNRNFWIVLAELIVISLILIIFPLIFQITGGPCFQPPSYFVYFFAWPIFITIGFFSSISLGILVIPIMLAFNLIWFAILAYLLSRLEGITPHAILGAILVLLLLIGVIFPFQIFPCGHGYMLDPNDAVDRQISNTINSSGAIRTTENLTFAHQAQLNADKIVRAAGINSDQICFSTGTFAEDSSGFSLLENNGGIIWNGSLTKTVKAKVVCEVSGVELDSLLQEHLDWFSNFPPNCEARCGSEKCCAVILQNAN